jgi:hypothetical protein
VFVVIVLVDIVSLNVTATVVEKDTSAELSVGEIVETVGLVVSVVVVVLSVVVVVLSVVAVVLSALELELLDEAQEMIVRLIQEIRIMNKTFFI